MYVAFCPLILPGSTPRARRVSTKRQAWAIIVPNSMLAQSAVKNLTLSDSLHRLSVGIGVAYAHDADHAIAVLRKPELQAGRTLELAGGEALTFAEVASRASVILEKPMAFVNETVEEAYASRAHDNAPSWQVDAWVSTYTAIAAGELAVVFGTILMLTGHPPRTLEDVL